MNHRFVTYLETSLLKRSATINNQKKENVRLTLPGR